ncbi:ParE family toxin-like protein [Sodalis sp. (in: enterobacteria)]|uniref:ParE family toxin-like protein n=1 Tax=Sodalis sp. (in: enterobacteria) TaxID=1898979 RepID=UPI003F39E7B3
MKPKIPDRVKKKAELYEHLYREGLKRARRIRRNGYLSMSLSLYWRMLSKDNGQSWKTMSHATYNTQITQ